MSNSLKMEFGFFPEKLDLAHGPVTVSTLPDFLSSKNEIETDNNIRSDWFYPGYAETRWAGDRIFSLPKTHVIEHANADGEQHLEFHIWALSFFVGMRLTWTEFGFLDTTPIKKGVLVDFNVHEKLDRAVELAENFWNKNKTNYEQIKRINAAIHSLFLSHSKLALQFEQFMYVYMALDACFAMLWEKYEKNNRQPPHTKRIDWMCKKLGVSIPTWAMVDEKDPKKTELSDLRNFAFHEALLAGEPFGFGSHCVVPGRNIVGAGVGNLYFLCLACAIKVLETQSLSVKSAP